MGYDAQVDSDVVGLEGERLASEGQLIGSNREVLGDYVLQKLLGKGPFGEIYLAEHRFIKRPFALKVLPPHVSANAGFLRRFEAKVSDIAKLDHPHIIKIHNVSCHEGFHFLVMDPIVDSFGETMNLDRYLSLKGKSLQEDDVENFLVQAASALDYAHDMGVIHGSLKLSNILVRADGESVDLLLTDFGLNRLIGEGVSFLRLCEEASQALMAGNRSERAQQISRNFLKNFSFLAPEQKTFQGEDSDAKVDTYAFGVLAYFFFAGKAPEGCFDLPSKMAFDLQKNWDLLIQRCLQASSHLRPQKLIQSMTECLLAPHSACRDFGVLTGEEKITDSIFQMSFEFPREDKMPARSSLAEAPKPVLKPQEITRPEYEPDPGAIFQRETLVSHYEPKKAEIPEIEPLFTDMAVIPSGTYVRGSNEGARDEMPRHAIHLSSFALDVHPVTNEQFLRFLQAMGGEKDVNNNDIIRLKDSRIKRSSGKLVIESGYARHPVVGVTWYGAVAYAKWIGKRLPTEAEWEAAASAGNEDALYPTGNEIEKAEANFFCSDTTAVCSYPPNPLGLHDMGGNVYEWCQDWYAYNYYDASLIEPDNPQGPPQGVYRVLRGGCWKSLKDDLRCAHRHRNNPGAVNGTYGFRCAADVS